MEGAPKFAESRRCPTSTMRRSRAASGSAGINVDTPDQLGPAWDTALAADRPVVIDVRCDPNVPPIPPHATFDQTKATAAAVLHGDEDTWGVRQAGREAEGAAVPARREGSRREGARHGGRIRDVRHGRFERTLSALTAAGSLITAAEIYLEHDAASFGNKMMWWPVVLGPRPGRGRRGRFPRRRHAPCCRSRRGRSWRTGCRARTCMCAASSRARAGMDALQHRARTAAVRPDAGVAGRRDGPGGRGAPARGRDRGRRVTLYRAPDHRAVVPPGAPRRFPGFDVLAQTGTWDHATAGVVLERLSPARRSSAFFSPFDVSAAPGRSSICCWGSTAILGCRCSS